MGEHNISRSAKPLLGRDLQLLGAPRTQRHFRTKLLTCRGRSLTSGRNLATISPLFGALAIRPSNTAVYVFEGTASKQGRGRRARADHVSHERCEKHHEVVIASHFSFLHVAPWVSWAIATTGQQP